MSEGGKMGKLSTYLRKELEAPFAEYCKNYRAQKGPVINGLIRKMLVAKGYIKPQEGDN